MISASFLLLFLRHAMLIGRRLPSSPSAADGSQVALGRPPDRLPAVPVDQAVPKRPVEPVVVERLDAPDDRSDHGGRQWDVVGVALREADVLPVGGHLDDVARQERAPAVSPPRPVQHRAAVEVTAAAHQGQPLGQRPRVALPEDDGWVGRITHGRSAAWR